MQWPLVSPTIIVVLSKNVSTMKKLNDGIMKNKTIKINGFSSVFAGTVFIANLKHI